MPRMPSKTDTKQDRRQVPLSEEYLPSYPEKRKAPKRKKSQIEEEDEGYIDSKSSRKILKIGQDLVDEEAKERQLLNPDLNDNNKKAFEFESRFAGDVISDEDDGAAFDDDGEEWQDDDEEVLEIDETDIDPKDLEMFNKFNPSFDPSTLLLPPKSTIRQEGEDREREEEEEEPGTDLSALILQRIEEHEAKQRTLGLDGSANNQSHAPDAIELPAKVVEVYTQIGLILLRYKSGKLPKPFKILPSLPQWDTLLSITRPDSWSANAYYEATKLFISSRPALAQAFLHDILLPKIREEQYESKKINVHLYKAVKKALYKPACFFKGFLFPLVESGTCTLREASVVGSVLTRVSVPVLHSAAALYRLCEVSASQMSVDTESGGATNIFIRVLLDKKYALPFRVVDALVFHFLRFKNTNIISGDDDVEMRNNTSQKEAKAQKLPVLWHQCLLSFAQRYKNDITEDQREALLDLLLVKGHKAIGPEVRRELLEGRGRGVLAEQSNDVIGGDDTMMTI